MEKLKDKYGRYKEWKLQPHQVAPLSEQQHECATCGTHYEGNYCPRCGQSASIGRYSFKNALLLFLDVWGLGNRGMFRSLRDLVLRPGYMIRDYLSGMQMAYFPPFKMLFLLITFSVLVDTGLNIKGQNRWEKFEAQYASGMNYANSQKTDPSASEKEKQEAALASKIMDYANKAYEWMESHQSIIQIFWLLLLSGPLYFFFRHSPAFPTIRYSEFFVALVYTNNLLIIASIFCGLLCLGFTVELVCCLLTLIPLKQLSGFSYLRTITNVVLAVALVGLVLVIVSAAFFFIHFG